MEIGIPCSSNGFYDKRSSLDFILIFWTQTFTTSLYIIEQSLSFTLGLELLLVNMN